MKTVELLSLISSLTSFTAPPSIKSKHIASVIRRIEQDFSLPLKLEELARECGSLYQYIFNLIPNDAPSLLHYVRALLIHSSIKDGEKRTV